MKVKEKENQIKSDQKKNEQINNLIIDLEHLDPKLKQSKSDMEKAGSAYTHISTELEPYASKNSHIPELIFLSIFVGMLFDWAIWQDMFQTMEGVQAWIARLLAAVVAIMTACSCAKLGEAMAIKSIVDKRDLDQSTNETESKIYNRVTLKQNFNRWLSACISFSLITAVLRAYSSHQTTNHWFTVQSLVMTGASIVVNLVIIFFNHEIYCLYSQDLRKFKSESEETKRIYKKLQAKANELDKKLRQLSRLDPPLVLATYGSPNLKLNNLKEQDSNYSFEQNCNKFFE